MLLSHKTLEKLREIINGDGTERYRSGPKLVEFFNRLGFRDTYGQGFPSRWVYTDEKLEQINGKPELDKCIRDTFCVIDYIDDIKELDRLIEEFNKYLVFDKWQVIRNNDEISFKRLERVIIPSSKNSDEEIKESEFLDKTFEIDISSLGLDSIISDIIDCRIKEIEKCISSDAPLAAVIITGSTMEGILLGEATSYPKNFNSASSAPKDKNSKVKNFQDWTLSNFIDVAYEIGLIKLDVKKFSHVVRDFRNFIHPYEQMVSRFHTDKNTALICLQVLKASIIQIAEYRKKLQ